MDSTSYLIRLPNEIMCMIVKYLSEDDKISLKFANPYFFCQHKSINAKENFSCPQECIVNVLHHHNSPDVFTKLDFSFCYWISSKEMCNFIKKCSNLNELAVANSTVSSQDLAAILCVNTKISRLSLSILSPERLWPNEVHVADCLWEIKGISKKKNTATLWEHLLSLSHFGKCQQALAQLECLYLHIGEHPIILATLISGCKNLENLSLRLEVDSDVNEEFKVPKIRAGASNIIESLLQASPLKHTVLWDLLLPNTLKSFAAQINNGKGTSCTIGSQMEKFLQQIVERSSGNLQCWWAPIPLVPVRKSDFIFKNMVAWKESKSFENFVPSHMPVMESLACNMYMQRGHFDSSQLTQVECGFQKNKFPEFCAKHPHLERARFNRRPHGEISKPYVITEWTPLPRLKVLSLHPRVIYELDHLQNSRALYTLLTNYPSLEELEIRLDVQESAQSSRRYSRESLIASDSLSELTICTNLKKVSIHSVTITYNQLEAKDTCFVEEIAIKCPNLQVLYVQDLDFELRNGETLERNSSLYNDCIGRFYHSLQSARKLRVLRLKLRVTSKFFHESIRLMASCSSLVQLGLIAASIDKKIAKLDMCNWKEAEFTAFFVDLVQRLPKLIALLVVLPGAPQSHCIAITSILKTEFLPTRPCFCVQITNSLANSNPPNLPLVHHQALAQDPHPLVGESPFHSIQIGSL